MAVTVEGTKNLLDYFDQPTRYACQNTVAFVRDHPDVRPDAMR